MNLPGTGSGPWKKAGLANTLRALDSIAALAPGLVHTLKPHTAAAPLGLLCALSLEHSCEDTLAHRTLQRRERWRVWV